jgi:hypothetical protein
MTADSGKTYKDKHGPQAVADPRIRDEILNKATDRELPCAVAFTIVDALGESASAVGQTMDLLGIRLTKCQLGLFGYASPKKIVTSRHPDTPEIGAAIVSALVDGRLPCRRAWDIAHRFHVRKMTVSGACEAMGVKIKPCQLGAF